MANSGKDGKKGQQKGKDGKQAAKGKQEYFEGYSNKCGKYGHMKCACWRNTSKGGKKGDGKQQKGRRWLVGCDWRLASEKLREAARPQHTVHLSLGSRRMGI